MSTHHMLQADAGATGDGSTNDYSAISAWLAHGISTGQPLWAEAGIYKFSSQINIDLNPIASKGLRIEGAGIGQSIFDGTSISTNPFIVGKSTGGNANYLKMKDFAIMGDYAGSILQIGDRSPWTTNMDAMEIDLRISNYSTSPSAIGVELNYVLNSRINLVANCNGFGTALKMGNTQFCEFNVSLGSADKAVWMTDGFNFGNLFKVPDMENVGTCLVMDGIAPCLNTFQGGQWNYNHYGIDSTSGGGGCHDNYLTKPNNAPNIGATAWIKSGSVGLTIV